MQNFGGENLRAATRKCIREIDCDDDRQMEWFRVVVHICISDVEHLISTVRGNHEKNGRFIML
jgi:hypothetical protein